jgi:hypothetical protein
MPKQEKRPVPHGHAVYPRGSIAPKALPKAPNGRRRPTEWTRAVPPDRAFPRV